MLGWRIRQWASIVSALCQRLLLIIKGHPGSRKMEPCILFLDEVDTQGSQTLYPEFGYNVVLMLVHRLRRWPYIKTTLVLISHHKYE